MPDPGSGSASARTSAVAEAFLAKDIDAEDNPVGKQFRLFAESRGADLKALAAVQLGSERLNQTVESQKAFLKQIKAINIPLMTIVGNDDFLPGDKARMAMLVKKGSHVQIQGKDHLTVVPDQRLLMAARAFLDMVNS